MSRREVIDLQRLDEAWPKRYLPCFVLRCNRSDPPARRTPKGRRGSTLRGAARRAEGPERPPDEEEAEAAQKTPGRRFAQGRRAGATAQPGRVGVAGGRRAAASRKRPRGASGSRSTTEMVDEEPPAGGGRGAPVALPDVEAPGAEPPPRREVEGLLESPGRASKRRGEASRPQEEPLRGLLEALSARQASTEAMLRALLEGVQPATGLGLPPHSPLTPYTGGMDEEEAPEEGDEVEAEGLHTEATARGATSVGVVEADERLHRLAPLDWAGWVSLAQEARSPLAVIEAWLPRLQAECGLAAGAGAVAVEQARLHRLLRHYCRTHTVWAPQYVGVLVGHYAHLYYRNAPPTRPGGRVLAEGVLAWCDQAEGRTTVPVEWEEAAKGFASRLAKERKLWGHDTRGPGQTTRLRTAWRGFAGRRGRSGPGRGLTRGGSSGPHRGGGGGGGGR